MKYSREYISKRLKEMSEFDSSKIAPENIQAMRDATEQSIKQFHEEFKNNSICPLTGEKIYTSEEWDRLMKKRFNC